MGGKTVACIQSSYIPWKGYFDIINMADIFVFYDDVQYSKENWRNRNKIKTIEGVKWLSVPCGKSINRLICDVKIEQSNWQRRHWAAISNNYSKSSFFKTYKELFEDLYLNNQWQWLSDLNQTVIKQISKEILGIDTEFRDSREFSLSDKLMKEDRWIELLKQIGTSDFVIGPSARDYLDNEKEKKINDNGINLIWMDYSGYPEYTQRYPPFDHHVSIIDLIFNVGSDAPAYMKSFR